jgi:guanosine-3',5'-bis(diphosphate) 3'-pyrophosphohydrolase
MSERLHHAIDLAARAHAGQYRKDTDLRIPYVAHVYGVAALLASHGFPEDVIVAGLLHDVLEDSPQFREEVLAFGANVQLWVETVTDPLANDKGKGDWLRRKETYIAQIREGAPEAKAIACADKIHNMESTLFGIRRGAPAHSRRPLAVQLEYWRRVRANFGGWEHPMLARYDELLRELSNLVADKVALAGH